MRFSEDKTTRAPEATASPAATGRLTLRAVGDIMLIAGAAAGLERNGTQYPFGPVAHWIAPADVGFGNLEMPICADEPRRAHFADVCPDFHAPAETAAALRETGFDVLNLANNHMMDWGLAGLRETLTRLREAGLQTIGAGETLHEARQPAYLVRNDWRIAFLGYGVRGAWNATPTQPGTAPIQREMILEDMRAIRGQVDLLIVSLHTGILADYPNPEDRTLARELIDQGADLILGHGPHVLQGVEHYGGRTIAYSLGNFIIDMSSGNVENKIALREQVESIILDVSLAPKTQPEVGFLPIRVSDDFQTVPAEGEVAERILTRMKTLSDNLERMQGLALWEHAGLHNVEHELRVLAFQTKEVGLRHAFKRLKKIRWRHMRLLVGYVVAKAKRALGRTPAGEQSLREEGTP